MSAQPKQKNRDVKSSGDTIEFVEELKRQWVETIDAIPDPFLVVKDDYTITKANAAMAELAGIDVKKLVGKRCHDVFAGRASPCENCHMKMAREGKATPGYEIFNERNDRWYEVATRRLTNLSGQQGVVQIYRDRTDAKKMQHQLAQNEKLASIGQLAGGFAHEINNPLGGILVFSQMLLREIPKDDPHYQDVVEIEAAAKRCKTIVDNLLDYSRQRPLKPKMETCDIHAVIKSAVKFAELGNNRDRGCNVFLELNAAEHTTVTDPNRLTQVFINLCVNGLQAMPEGGTLRVTTSNTKSGSQKFLVTQVADDGTGISAENLVKIFEPFFTTKPPGKGTGLGLSIVHGIVQDIGGSIEATSKLGQGSRFTLKLPLISKPPVKESKNGKI